MGSILEHKDLSENHPIGGSEADTFLVMAGEGPIGVEIAGWRQGCCYNVMACEGAPSTTSADIGTAGRGWRPHGRHDEKERPAPRPILTPRGRRPAIHDLHCWSQQGRGWPACAGHERTGSGYSGREPGASATMRTRQYDRGAQGAPSTCRARSARQVM